MSEPKLRMTFDVLETECLLLWLEQASHTIYSDPNIRARMQALQERLLYAVQAQNMPNNIHTTAYGDFS